MKKILFLLPLMALTGCGTLIPKSVEFFQRKVKAVPEVSDRAKETQRQAADFIEEKTDEARLAAIEDGASTNVVVPISEAHTVADALSESLGPPENPWKKEAYRLAQKLKEQQAEFNDKLAAYTKKVDKDEGKKIEGTGLVRVPYFVYIGCIALVIFLAWIALKTYGAINPAVGIGTNLVGRVSSKLLSRGFAEVVQGAEHFKKAVVDTDFTDEEKEEILDLFKRHSMQAQSRDVQDIVRKATIT